MTRNKTTIGWREWVTLPSLPIPAINAKIDTGARTSCLHAFDVSVFEQNGLKKVRFGVHPLQRRSDVVQWCETELIDQRSVRDSGGHKEDRIVISGPLRMGGDEWDIEMTLTSRDDMIFRMLIGRTALRGRYVVDPAKSYLLGKELRKYSYNAEDRKLGG